MRNFTRIFFSLLSSIHLLIARINSAWISSYCSRIVGFSNRGGCRVINCISSILHQFVWNLFQNDSPCPKESRPVGLASFGHRTTEKSTENGAGSPAAVAAAAAESNRVFSVLRPPHDPIQLSDCSSGCHLSAPVGRSWFHQVSTPKSSNYSRRQKQGKDARVKIWISGKRCNLVLQLFRACS